jgi:opacity protein-like surface antigen
MTIWEGGGVGYVIIGGGVYDITIRDLESGQSTVYTMYAIGIGVGLPTFRGSSRPVIFNDDCKKKSDSFSGYGYIGGASAEVGGGVKVGGGIKIPNGPFIPGSMIGWDRGGFDIGVSHSLTYWYK